MRYMLIALFAAVFFCPTMLLPQGSHAAKITLKSGKEITAEIIEKTDSYVKIDFNGTPVYYELKYISGIQEVKQPGGDNPAAAGSIIEENKKLKEDIRALQGTIRQMSLDYSIKLGDLYAQNDYFYEAIKAYENALLLSPDNPNLEYNLGVLFETGKKDAAKAAEHYRNYLRLRPDAPDKEEIGKIIASLTNNPSF